MDNLGNKPENSFKVFISYSRDDFEFADQLVAGLKVGGFEPTIDLQGISSGEDWRGRFGQLPRDTDPVVFVFSPSPAHSEICAWEFQEATRLQKQIIPVLCRSLEGAQPPLELANL